MSSSPPQERPGFVKATREGLAFLLKYENPLTEFFNNQPMYFMLKADGTWEQTTAPASRYVRCQKRGDFVYVLPWIRSQVDNALLELLFVCFISQK